MARSRFCRICSEFHDLDEPWPEPCVGHFGQQSAGAGEARFFVISDNMDAVRSHVDNRFYDSKSQYYRAVRAAGCEIVGNERLTRKPKKAPPVGPDLKRAIEQLSNR